MLYPAMLWKCRIVIDRVWPSEAAGFRMAKQHEIAQLLAHIQKSHDWQNGILQGESCGSPQAPAG